uniref:ZM domain-containing protein n=1 Tax=Macrostomum lignano TaxID=282301 RepID=A0A1I8FW57_9PLAT
MSWIAPPTEPFQSESVNRADFQYRQGERQQPIRPKNEIERAEGPFNGESSSRDAYKAWQAQPRYRHQQPAYERPEGSMDLRTTYSNEFANSGPRVRLPPIRPESQHRQLRDPNAAFAGHSEQAESFPGYKRAQISDAKPASFKPNRQYQPPECGTRTSCKVSTEPMVNRGAGSNAEYGAAAGVGGAVAAKRQPIVPRGELSIPAGAFAAETTQRGDFAPQTSRQQSRREPIRHASELQLNSGTAEPFSARTVAQQDFEARRGERPA